MTAEADPATEAERGPGRGRPRSESVGRAIREAARAILAAEGYDGLTFEAVATQAGVAKTTVYRRYADRVALIVDVGNDIADAQPEPDTGNLHDDLVSVLASMAHTFSDPVTGAMLAAVIGQMGRAPRLAEAMRGAVIARRMAAMELVFRRSITRGDIPSDTDWWLHTQRLVGPLVMRTLLTHEPIDEPLVRRIVALELRSLGLPE